MMHRVVAVIPARYASQRLPGKPLADILGRPMIQHVVERVREARTIGDVVVATDDERIADAVRAFGCTVAMTPANVQTGTDRVALVADGLHGTEIIANVQGDEPMIAPEMIDEAVAPLLAEPMLQVGTLVRRLQQNELENPSVVKVVRDQRGNALYFSRSLIPFVRDSADRENVQHFKHIGIYVFRREFLMEFAKMKQTPLELSEKLEQLRILEHGYAIRATETIFDSVPVDTQADLDRVRTMMRAMV